MNGRPGVWSRAWPTAVILLLSLPIAYAADSPEEEDEEEEQEIDFREIFQHVIRPVPMVSTPWKDLTDRATFPSWTFVLNVDDRGVVTAAKLKDGGRELLEEATRVARQIRFEPFIRDGKPAPVRLEYTVESRPKDYLGPADRAFPATPDPATIIIALRRTGCFGTCPSYRVELRGNGEVKYEGEGYVLVKGLHRWRVDPARIARLLELFRRANYFALDGYYMYPVTDLPTFITRLRVGKQDKIVLNYGGSIDHEDVIDEDDEEEAAGWKKLALPEMPRIVSEIEDAIDEISGAASYVGGDDSTLSKLRAERWNFRSQAAGDALRLLLSDCKTGLAREFIRAGAPVNVGGEGFDRRPPIDNAARCGDVDFARLLVQKGALDRPADAHSFLWATVRTGHPDMVALALTRDKNVNAKNESGDSLLGQAAGSSVLREDSPIATRFDSAKVIELLVRAGADVNARDRDGRTPLFEAQSAAAVDALLRNGADFNARNSEGQTALFTPYYENAQRALLAAGIDVNARDHSGRTALFFQQFEGPMKILLEAGADLEVTDSNGRTAIEQMNSRAVTSMLLEAGAKLPKDPARLKAMIDEATQGEWQEVLPRLDAAAANR
jgi:ankyrin repeat protein